MTDAPDARLHSPVADLARVILIHGPILRSDLAQRLGMSAATLTRLTKPLIDGGLVVEGHDVEGGLGRPARPLDVNASARRFLGVKLTGDSAVASLTDLRADELGHAEVALSSHEVEHVVDVITALVDEFGGSEFLTAIGISLGGSVAGHGVVASATFLDWIDVDLGRMLEARIGLPVFVENDLVALTAAEHWFGRGRGLDTFAVVTVGAGVGYGLVVHDRVVSTPDTGLGLGGHIPLDPFGPLCFLGHHGCSAAMLTISSIRAQVRVASGEDLEYDEILERAAAGDPVAAGVISAAASALGRMLAAVANFTTARRIVIAGEGARMVEVAGGALHSAFAADRAPNAAGVDLILDDTSFTAWARGAAAVAIQETLVAIATSA